MHENDELCYWVSEEKKERAALTGLRIKSKIGFA